MGEVSRPMGTMVHPKKRSAKKGSAKKGSAKKGSAKKGSAKKSVYDTTGRCNADGPKYTTPKGRPCTHSAECSRVRILDGQNRVGPPGWGSIAKSCMGPEPTHTRINTPGIKAEHTGLIMGGLSPRVGSSGGKIDRIGRIGTDHHTPRNKERQPQRDVKTVNLHTVERGPYNDMYIAAKMKSKNSTRENGKLFWKKLPKKPIVDVN
jgi:hypothetical protein